MKVLFIGGTGIISSACSQLAVDRGIELYILNRGQTSKRPVPTGAKVLVGDIRQPQSVLDAMGDMMFDAIVDWVAYTPDQVEIDLALFGGRTGQYVYISSASVYHKPVLSLPITESTPLHNPYWAYSRNKIACEERLMRAYREEGFPITIVRPSHTYDQTTLPFQEGYTVVDRMRKGLPVVVHGDGTTRWVMTHHRDFAKAFVGLLGHPQALGEAYHITSDEALTWNQIFRIVGRAAGVSDIDIVHVPSEMIHAYDANWGDGLLGDKAYSVAFDNSKIKRLVPDYVATIPFVQGAAETMAWFDAEPARQAVDEDWNQLLETIVGRVRGAYPE
ncbi:MAG: SDR family oxidoreductase [Anaerolineae bacterium]|nr:SDR family oxidoreductase [Anaerolineae bacterium]